MCVLDYRFSPVECRSGVQISEHKKTCFVWGRSVKSEFLEKLFYHPCISALGWISLTLWLWDSSGLAVKQLNGMPTYKLLITIGERFAWIDW